MKRFLFLFQELKVHQFFAVFTLLAIVYFNLTPFVGVDCWWHMRFADYFLQNGRPVIYDPFAIQFSKILATYPDLFPGLLFWVIYKYYSYLGLNFLRVAIFSGFIATLLFLVRKRWSTYTIIFQIIVLALAMTGRVLLQPDLFNYIFFTVWIYVLEQIVAAPNKSTMAFVGLMLVEQLWVNSHPLFFYHGLFVAGVYLVWALVENQRNAAILADAKSTRKRLWFYTICLASCWLANPLGWRALESLFVNMLDPSFKTASTESFVASLPYANTYAYLLILPLFLLERPWRFRIARSSMVIHFVLLIIILIPALLYERCLPFLGIFLIIFQGRESESHLPMPELLSRSFMVLVVLGCMLLIFERNFVFAPSWVAKLGLQMSYFKQKGLSLGEIDPQENIREINILNQLAAAGNCVTNNLVISSDAVWHSPDKPFFMHGHAAVINARYKEMEAFLSSLASEDAEHYMIDRNLQTLVLVNSNKMYLEHHKSLDKYLQLIYMDPFLAIYVRKGSITPEQRQRIKEFYATFRPGKMDVQRFSPEKQVMQYLLLWFSAEMTGNSGEFYWSVAERYLPAEALANFKEQVTPMIESARRTLLSQEVLKTGALK
jgi:hypothetical protein